MSIATEITRIQQAKADIKTAIEAKGVTVPSSATIDTYDDYVSQISGGGGGMSRNTSGTPYCTGHDLYVDVTTDISIDGGTSWVESGVTTILVESGSSQCVRLPQGYTEVEYVENTGTSYFNTNFTPNQNTRVVMEYQMVTDSGAGRMWGAGAWNSATGIEPNYEGGYLGISWLGNTSWTRYNNFLADYNKHILDLNKNYLYLDETLVGSNTFTTRTASDPIGVFTYIASGRPSSSSYWGLEHFKGKMFSFQIYDNGTLVRDLVPCIKDSDNTVGAYDIVNDVFYTVPTGYTTDKLVAGNPV